MPAFKKRYGKILIPQLSTWRIQLRFSYNKVTLFNRNVVLPPKTFLVWHWCCLTQCNAPDKNQLLSLYAVFL